MIDLDADTVVAAAAAPHRSSASCYLRLGVTATASDRVFTNEIGDPIRPNSIGQAFRRLVKEAGVPAHPAARPPPHPRQSHLLMAGINVKVVSERLGHASVELHPRHLRPRDARPASPGRIGRRSIAEGVSSTLLPRIMSAII